VPCHRAVTPGQPGPSGLRLGVQTPDRDSGGPETASGPRCAGPGHGTWLHQVEVARFRSSLAGRTGPAPGRPDRRGARAAATVASRVFCVAGGWSHRVTRTRTAVSTSRPGHGTPDLNRRRGWGWTHDAGKSGVGLGVDPPIPGKSGAGVGMDPRSPANRGSGPGVGMDGIIILSWTHRAVIVGVCRAAALNG
jgi:hypothetical protein